MIKKEELKAAILGTGSFVPSRILSNSDLEKMVDTSDAWITQRTGIKERRIADPEMGSSDLGIQASLRALENASIEPSQVDMVLVATCTPDYLFPSTACLIQKGIKADKAAALDVQAACTGFIYALSLAKSLVESGTYRYVLVVAAEKISSFVNYADRNSCVLFGDGAGAALIGPEKSNSCTIGPVILGADGEQSHLLMLQGGGSKNPASLQTIENNMHYLNIDGKEVFKHAVRRMTAAAKQAIEAAGLKETDISWFVPHQANLRIIEALAKDFQIPEDRICLTIQKYGNTSASSVAIALDELFRQNKVEVGDVVLVAAFGAGFTWGAVAFRRTK